ncbi:MAG: agmatine deiminase family protein [Acidobacteriota bacterium]
MTSPTAPLRVLCDLRVAAVKLDAKPAGRGGPKEAEIAKRVVPREAGFRMPAEWESHEATWIGWPHNRTDWPGKFATIPWVYGEIVRKLTPGETVRIIVNSQAHEARARRVLSRANVDLRRVEFLRFPTNRGWTRDFGPMFVKRDDKRSEVAIVRFRFNAWAKYSDWKKDDKVPERSAKALGMRVLNAQLNGRDVVLEGGAIDINGRGTLITTEECLLDQETQARNPGLSRAQIESALCDNLGVTNVLWLGRGIEGDDTHGHVDDLCRFVDARTVVICSEENSKDHNYRVLEENRERLESMRLEDGSKIQVVPIPMPAPLWFDGRRLPASYANFYIANSAVLVPTFNDPNDRVALGILSELITDRPVVGVHAVDLVWGLGTVHCMTQQQPAHGTLA